jgi:serine/threonine-protein kinase
VVTPVRGSGRAERIGSYSVIAELATGASSRVLLGQRDDEPEVRVLKQLRLELASDSVARMRFQREALLAARLAHPNIAKICWSGIEDGSFCIAMEFVAGQTLAAIASKLEEAGRRMPQPAAISIVLSILNGLAYAHDLTDGAGQPLSIVHRDLSLDNIMVGYAGEVKIIDFGTARARLGDFRTSPGVRIGTLSYMSPEQSMSSPVDRRSDLYTVAVVLWELLTGERLVKSSAPVDVLEEIAYRVPPPASELVPAISEELAGVVARGLAKDPEHRWQTAQEFAEALIAELASPQSSPLELGAFVRELFPDAEAAAASAIELARQRHFQDHEETMPDNTSPSPPASADNTLYLDTFTPDSTPPASSSELRLPPEPKATPSSTRLWLAIFVALMIGFTLGLATERMGWWRAPPPGGAHLQGGNPR